MSMQNLKVIEAAYNKMAKIKDTNFFPTIRFTSRSTT